MTKIAFIGDIHGYAPALKIALEWCQREDVGTIVGLGDYVDGYDADERCVDLVQQHFAACVRGNHDEDHSTELSTKSERWLNGLPQSIEHGEWLITHSSPRSEQADEYVRSSFDAWNCFDDCDFKRCVVGHAHEPMLYGFSNAKGFDSDALDATGEGQVLDENSRYLLVNPSLAYNRSGQQNPGFSIYESDTQRVRIVYLDLPQLDRQL